MSLLEGVVHPKILTAMRAASAQLRAVGVRHAIAGALAVGAHGYPRATRDVDFLVGDEAFVHHAGGIVTIAEGVPIAVGDVGVDPMSAAAGEEHLDDAIDAAFDVTGEEDVPVIGIGALVYTKLKSSRWKDIADIVELIKAGIDQDAVLEYLQENALAMESRFLQLVAEAESEEQEENHEELSQGEPLHATRRPRARKAP